MARNKLIFLDKDDPEFQVAFSNFEDTTMYNEQYGEVLQYMGTVLYYDGKVTHQFRHRALPETNERKYWEYPASTNFKARIRQKGKTKFTKFNLSI